MADDDETHTVWLAACTQKSFQTSPQYIRRPMKPFDHEPEGVAREEKWQFFFFPSHAKVTGGLVRLASLLLLLCPSQFP